MEIDWAGIPFLALGIRDASMVRLPGLFAFVRRGPTAERTILLVDHAITISTGAGPAHPLWEQAMRLGLDEIHVNLQAAARIDGFQLVARIVRHCQPPLNRSPADLVSDQRDALAELRRRDVG